MKIILAVIMFLAILDSNCQEIYTNPKYFTNLIGELSTRNDIRNIRFYEARYLNGKIKYQEIHVNYSIDPMNRNWIAGQAFQYYKNGNLKVRQEFDLINNLRIDTGLVYYKNGSVKQLFINLNDSIYAPIPEKVIFKNIWYYNPIKFGIVNFWKNGNKKNEYTLVFIEDKYKFDGYFISYNKEGNVILKKKYINGKKIKVSKSVPLKR